MKNWVSHMIRLLALAVILVPWLINPGHADDEAIVVEGGETQDEASLHEISRNGPNYYL